MTREFIRAAIEEAIKRLDTDAKVEDADDVDQWEIDHDTRGVSGSPPIAETICKKIDECAIFIADVSMVSEYTTDNQRKKKSVNGNVLIELGYARGKCGLGKIVTVQNTHFGKPDDLPFDLKHLRHPIQFDLTTGMSEPNKEKQRVRLVETLEAAFR